MNSDIYAVRFVLDGQVHRARGERRTTTVLDYLREKLHRTGTKGRPRTSGSVPLNSLVQNPIDRYSIGDRTKGLRHAPDGSLELVIQHESPGTDVESNWLPAPKGDFSLSLRCYLPRPAIYDGTWKPPAVKLVE